MDSTNRSVDPAVKGAAVANNAVNESLRNRAREWDKVQMYEPRLIPTQGHQHSTLIATSEMKMPETSNSRLDFTLDRSGYQYSLEVPMWVPETERGAWSSLEVRVSEDAGVGDYSGVSEQVAERVQEYAKLHPDHFTNSLIAEMTFKWDREPTRSWIVCDLNLSYGQPRGSDSGSQGVTDTVMTLESALDPTSDVWDPSDDKEWQSEPKPQQSQSDSPAQLGLHLDPDSNSSSEAPRAQETYPMANLGHFGI